MNPTEILICLGRRKLLIAKLTGLGLLLGLVAAFVIPVRYTATTELMPPRETPSLASLFLNQVGSSGNASLSMLAGGALGLRNPNDLYIGLLESRPVADSIIRQFGLRGVYHAKDMTGARAVLKSRTRIESEKSSLIAVSVTDADRKRAAGMANAYTAQLRALTQSLAITEASQRCLFYEDQLKEARQNLVTAEFAFQQVQKAKGLVQPTAQATAMIDSLASLRAQAAAKEVDVQALRSYSTDRNPDVELAENQLASLKAEIAKMDGRGQSPHPGQLGIAELPGAGLAYLTAEHEFVYRQTLYDLLIKQYDAARLDEGREALILQVVEPATAPDRKSSPKRVVVTLIGGLAGLCFGCVITLKPGYRSREEMDPVAARQLWELKEAFALRSRSEDHHERKHKVTPVSTL